jgi:NADH-quinone oxidoreductase subunit L
VVVAAASAAGAEPALVEEAALALPLAADTGDPGDPGRLLLGPLHRPAAHGFHLDAVYSALFVRPVLAAAGLVRFLDREVIETYVQGSGAAPRLLGAAVRKAQTGNVQTYLSVLLAGSVVLAVLVAVGA